MPRATHFNSRALRNAGGGVQHYLVENTVKLKIDVADRLLALRFPGKDWIDRVDNQNLARRLAAYNGHVGFGPLPRHSSFHRFLIDFGPFAALVLQGLDARTTQGVQLIDDICHGCSQPQGEVVRITREMLKVWKTEAASKRRRLANEQRRRH
jgi:hypothetical protein